MSFHFLDQINLENIEAVVTILGTIVAIGIAIDGVRSWKRKIAWERKREIASAAHRELATIGTLFNEAPNLLFQVANVTPENTSEDTFLRFEAVQHAFVEKLDDAIASFKSTLFSAELHLGREVYETEFSDLENLHNTIRNHSYLLLWSYDPNRSVEDRKSTMKTWQEATAISYTKEDSAVPARFRAARHRLNLLFQER